MPLSRPLSVVGGLIGAALGSGITIAAGQAFPDGLAVSPLSLLLSAGFAVGIGLTASVYPALRAARLAPVDALRAALGRETTDGGRAWRPSAARAGSRSR